MLPNPFGSKRDEQHSTRRRRRRREPNRDDQRRETGARRGATHRRQRPQDESVAAAEKPKDLEQALRQHLETDPLFQVTTVDGMYWIDPHTGTVVDAPFDRVESALAWLQENQPWKTQKLKPLIQLRYIRWRRFLLDNLIDDPHLRLFSDQGLWLNPYIGVWEEQVRCAPERKISSTLLSNMAKCLISYPEEQLHNMLPMAHLDQMVAGRLQHERRGPKPSDLCTASQAELSLTAVHTRLAPVPQDVNPGQENVSAPRDYADLDSPDFDFLTNLGSDHSTQVVPEPPEAPPPVKPVLLQTPVRFPTPIPSPSESVNLTLDGDDSCRQVGGFRIGTKLAEDALGVLYVGHDGHGQDVVVKVFTSQLSTDPEFAATLVQEGLRIQQLQDRHLVTCRGVGLDAGVCYFARNLMTKGDAAQLASRQERGLLPWRLALSMVRGACRGLLAVHRAGLVHSKVCPVSIFVDGTSARLGTPRPSCCATHARRIPDLRWLSPEQVDGQAADHRSDCYGLALSLFTLASGVVPYHDANEARMRERIRHDPPPDLNAIVSDCPNRASQAIRRCMSKDPETRLLPDELLQVLSRG
jgi:hypothetical protein